MIPFFDRDCNCIGYFDVNDGMVFSYDLEWIGFIENNYFFDRNMNWLGGMINESFVDKKGKVVAWLEGTQPCGTTALVRPLRPVKPITPIKPIRPLTPLRPLRPLTPLGGWSELTWNCFLNLET